MTNMMSTIRSTLMSIIMGCCEADQTEAMLNTKPYVGHRASNDGRPASLIDAETRL